MRQVIAISAQTCALITVDNGVNATIANNHKATARIIILLTYTSRRLSNIRNLGARAFPYFITFDRYINDTLSIAF